MKGTGRKLLRDLGELEQAVAQGEPGDAQGQHGAHSREQQGAVGPEGRGLHGAEARRIAGDDLHRAPLRAQGPLGEGAHDDQGTIPSLHAQAVELGVLAQERRGRDWRWPRGGGRWRSGRGLLLPRFMPLGTASS